MFFDSGVEAAMICFTDVSTFTSRTGELYTTELWYLAGVLSLFGSNELLLVVFQLMMKLHFNFSSGVILCINERVSLVPYLPR